MSLAHFYRSLDMKFSIFYVAGFCVYVAYAVDGNIGAVLQAMFWTCVIIIGSRKD